MKADPLLPRPNAAAAAASIDRVYFVCIHARIKIYHVRTVGRTHTNAIRVDFKIAAAAAPRRRHKLLDSAFSIPAGYPKDRVPTAPKHAGGGGEGKRERTIGNREPISCPTLLSYPPPSLSFWRRTLG